MRQRNGNGRSRAPDTTDERANGFAGSGGAVVSGRGEFTRAVRAMTFALLFGTTALTVRALYRTVSVSHRIAF